MSVQAVEVFSPYANVIAQFTEGLPTWMDRSDAERIKSYQIYEQIYWNVPDTFKLVLRGEENASPIYVPTARTIVDTTNRYLCPNPAFVVDPDLGSPVEREACRLAYSALFRRERFWSKFQSNKWYGVMRGDWCWHVIANPAKPPGRRIKIEAIDPAAYFPVYHPQDPDRIIAVHIVEQVIDEEDNETYIRRQTYQRGADPVNNDGSDTTIYNSIGLFDVEAWRELGDRAIIVVKPLTPLPPAIKAIPVYHVPNIQTPGDTYGSSELRGFERIIAAVNQAVSDEEIALALEGLGMYHTDGGPPTDENNNPTDWVLGPGRVVEHGPGSTFGRVNGVTSVAPVQDHLKFLITQLKEASATPDAAIGKVDITVAESGIALIMQLAPLLAKIEVREELITDVHEQMFYDLRDWMEAYEGFITPCIVHPVWGSKLPVNRVAAIKEIIDIYTAGLADITWAQRELGKLGFEFDEGMADRILSEAAARARATDPFAARMESEIDEEEGGDDA
jgi:hypothetical protein